LRYSNSDIIASTKRWPNIIDTTINIKRMLSLEFFLNILLNSMACNALKIKYVATKNNMILAIKNEF